MTRRSPRRPDGAVTVRDHQRLLDKMELFAMGKYPFVVLIGRSGVGKTATVRRAMQQAGVEPNDAQSGYGYHRGRITGIELYKWLYRFRDRPIVIDDTPDLWDEPHIPALIQAVTETIRESRHVCWRSNHADIGDPANGHEEKTPPEFFTSSSVLIITNDWPTASPTIHAVETRATQTILFAPSNEDIHRKYVPTWFETSSPVYSFIGRCLDQIPSLHCRFYGSGDLLYRNEPDHWQEDLLSAMLPESHSLAVFYRLHDDKSYATDTERIREFTRLGAGSIATWKRIKRDLGLVRPYRRPCRTPDTLTLSTGAQHPAASQNAVTANLAAASADPDAASGQKYQSIAVAG